MIDNKIKIISSYRNGNYNVLLLNDGTKIRFNNLDNLTPSFAENIDIKITNKCTGTNCKFCHEGSGVDGKQNSIINLPFWDTLHRGQEVSLGGGNILEHPEYYELLKKLKSNGVITNITLNQIHFMQNLDLVESLINDKLVYGVGVSLVSPTKKLIEELKKPIFKNTVLHTINGILSKEDIDKLKDNDIKLLILGYKRLRRGEDYFEKESKLIEKNQKWLEDNIKDLFDHFSIISFDNLSIEQLNIKDKVNPKTWNECYMGDDGTTTFYIDCVERKFAINSTAPMNERYDLLDNVDDMFNKIKKLDTL